MQRIINNLLHSKSPIMLILRYVLVSLVVVVGLLRLRLILIHLSFPHSYTTRDILQEYLMAKALVSGISPYLPADKLVQMFIGPYTYYPNPAPYPPFVALFSTPLLLIDIDHLVIVWLVFELCALMAIAWMLSYFLSGRVDWMRSILLFFVLLAWSLVMVELYYGQLTILLTTLLFAALICMQKGRSASAGLFVGLTVALKLITWPFLIYFAIKKDWRALISGSLTALILNLIALGVMGFRPFMDYYLHIPRLMMSIWHDAWYNFSLWSVGYRLFEGTSSAIMSNNLNAPPLFNSPGVAPYASAILVAVFFILGMKWANKSKNGVSAFALLVCICVAVSPFSWDHYYILLIIALAVLIQTLAKQSFPPRETGLSLVLMAMLFLFNEHIQTFIEGLNGGRAVLQANGYHISFASSLIEWLPIIELVGLTLLVWHSAQNHNRVVPGALAVDRGPA